MLTHHTFHFTPQRRLFSFPWRVLAPGCQYPKDSERCIYFYSTFDTAIGTPVPFYLGQRRHAYLLSRSLSLRHYRWWRKYENQRIRCDVFRIEDRHFLEPLSEASKQMKLYSIEHLAARLIERRLRPHNPLSENRGFQFTFNWLKAKDVRAMAVEVARSI